MDLRFPSYRTVNDVLPDEHLGTYSASLWVKVMKDIKGALQENSEAYDECEEKIFKVKNTCSHKVTRAVDGGTGYFIICEDCNKHWEESDL